MRGVDAGVEDRDDRGARRRDGVACGLPADPGQRPLVGEPRIVGNGRDGASLVGVDAGDAGVSLEGVYAEEAVALGRMTEYMRRGTMCESTVASTEARRTRAAESDVPAENVTMYESETDVSCAAGAVPEDSSTCACAPDASTPTSSTAVTTSHAFVELRADLL